MYSKRVLQIWQIWSIICCFVLLLHQYFFPLTQETGTQVGYAPVFSAYAGNWNSSTWAGGIDVPTPPCMVLTQLDTRHPSIAPHSLFSTSFHNPLYKLEKCFIKLLFPHFYLSAPVIKETTSTYLFHPLVPPGRWQPAQNSLACKNHGLHLGFCHSYVSEEERETRIKQSCVRGHFISW